MNKRIKIIFICIFLSILVLPTFTWLTLKVINNFNPEIMETIDFDTNENRNKNEFPTNFNIKTYTSEIEDWYDDHSPFRSVLYSFENKLDLKYESIYTNKLQTLFNNIASPITKEDLLDSYNKGYESGKSNSSITEEELNTKYNEGYLKGIEDGTNNTYNEAYNKGLADGETKGIDLGYTKGYTEAYAKAYEEASDKAYMDGYKKGYDEATKKSEEQEACSHEYNDGEVISDSTCTNLGVMKKTCTKCGKIIIEEIPKKEHDIYVETIDSTCSSTGETIKKCHNCDYEEHIEIPKKEHDTYTIKEDATCAKEGSITTKCHNCDYVNVETLEKLEHNYVIVEHMNETCLDDGYNLSICTNCGDNLYETIEHHHDYQYVQTIKADYTTYGYDLYKCSVCKGIIRKNIVEKPIDTSYFALTYANDSVIYGRSNWLFYAKNDSLTYFQGDNDWSTSDLENLKFWFNMCNELCKQNGKELYYIIAPNKEEVYYEYYPSVTVYKEDKRVERMVDYLHSNTSCNVSYFKQALLSYKSKLDLYLRLDTHWNKAGAYVGVTELYKLMNLPYIDITELTVKQVEDIYGDLVLLGSLYTKDYYSDVNYEISYPGLKSRYKDLNLKSNMVVIGDSYRERMESFLEVDFNLTSFHREDMADYKKEIKNSDYIIVQVVERYDFKMTNIFKQICDILKEN